MPATQKYKRNKILKIHFLQVHGIVFDDVTYGTLIVVSCEKQSTPVTTILVLEIKGEGQNLGVHPSSFVPGLFFCALLNEN